MKPKYSLVIPCYNEEGNIQYLFKSLRKLNNKYLEIILVDNGSKDLTYKTLNYFKKKNKKLNIKILKIKNNIGFGNGVFAGLKKSKGKYLCYTHADRETKIIDLQKVFRLIDINYNSDFLIKGRRVNRIKNHWTFLDEIFSRSCDILLSLIFFNRLLDIHAQPNAFSKDLLKKINYHPKDFLIDAYLLYAAKKMNYKIQRFNVNFNKKSRKYGQGSSDNIFKKLRGGFDHIIGGFKILFKSNI